MKRTETLVLVQIAVAMASPSSSYDDEGDVPVTELYGLTADGRVYVYVSGAWRPLSMAVNEPFFSGGIVMEEKA